MVGFVRKKGSEKFNCIIIPKIKQKEKGKVTNNYIISKNKNITI